MGGSHSSSSATATSNIINSFSQNFSANCGTNTTSDNAIIITGNGNNIANLIQNSSSSSDAKCQVYNPQTAVSAATLSAAAASSSAAISQQFTGFLDDSSSDSNSTITSTLSNTINQNTLFSCAANVQSANLVLVDGSGNVIQGSTQDSSSNAISNCLMSAGQSASIIANVTQNASSTSSTTVQSWLQPFATMFQSIMVDMVVAVVAFVIFIVLIVIVYKMLGSSSKNVTTTQQVTKNT